MDIQGQVIALACSAAMSAGGAWWFLQRFSQARHLLDTPTSKIRSAAQGYVESCRVLRDSADPQLPGPLTHTPCLWWRYKIEEYTSNGKKRSWRTLENASSEA